ncbi:MAG: hypothetical protein ACE5K8_05165 [Candidatus Zixiibacteriota bacterium]
MMKWLWFAFIIMLVSVFSCSNRHAGEAKLPPILKAKMTSTDWVLIPIEERFTTQELEWLQKNKNSIQNELVDSIKNGSIPAIQVAEHLKLESVLPVLREKLLILRHPYGFEGPDYSKEESYLFDDQYPYHKIYIHAIEKISGLPISKAVSLTGQEKAWLIEMANGAKIDSGPLEAWCAKWLLTKLNS